VLVKVALLEEREAGVLLRRPDVVRRDAKRLEATAMERHVLVAVPQQPLELGPLKLSQPLFRPPLHLFEPVEVAERIAARQLLVVEAIERRAPVGRHSEKLPIPPECAAATSPAP
jgi:hypothetical protein